MSGSAAAAKRERERELEGNDDRRGAVDCGEHNEEEGRKGWK